MKMDTCFFQTSVHMLVSIRIDPMVFCNNRNLYLCKYMYRYLKPIDHTSLHKMSQLFQVQILDMLLNPCIANHMTKRYVLMYFLVYYVLASCCKIYHFKQVSVHFKQHKLSLRFLLYNQFVQFYP